MIKMIFEVQGKTFLIWINQGKIMYRHQVNREWKDFIIFPLTKENIEAQMRDLTIEQREAEALELAQFEAVKNDEKKLAELIIAGRLKEGCKLLHRVDE